VSKRLSLEGKKFGKLLVICGKGVTKNNRKFVVWKCLCDCGNIIEVLGSNPLTSGNTKSCGCYQRQRSSESRLGDKNPAKQPEIRKKLSIAAKKRPSNQLGLKRSPELKKRLSDIAKQRPPKSEETRRKISIANKGKLVGNKNPMFGKHLSVEARKRISEANSGPLCHLWRGGISFEPYCKSFNNRFKEYIREKFDRKCFICGKLEIDCSEKLHVHHVDYNKNSICNGKSWPFIPICRSCHTKTNFNRHYWFNLLINYWLENNDIHLNTLLEVSL